MDYIYNDFPFIMYHRFCIVSNALKFGAHTEKGTTFITMFKQFYCCGLVPYKPSKRKINFMSWFYWQFD